MRSSRIIAAAFFAALAIHSFVLEPFRCTSIEQRYIRRTETAARRVSDVSDATVARDNVSALTEAAEKCRRAELHVLIAENLVLLGRYDEAVRAYDAALRITERASFYSGRGATRLRAGQVDAALADLARGARFSGMALDPVDQSLHARIMEVAEEQTRADAERRERAAQQ